jgi:molybdenum cofactor guanylyltransferase
MKDIEITGFLIAGGKSHRMKTDKTFVLYKGIPLVQYPLQILSEFCSKIYINSNSIGYEKPGIEVVADKYLDSGPLGGIVTCLELTNTEHNLFLPVDTPNISSELIQILIKSRNKGDIIIPIKDGLVEPLVGIYNRRSLSQLTDILKDGKLKLVDVLKEMNTCYVNIDELTISFDKNIFKNINSQDDLI